MKIEELTNEHEPQVWFFENPQGSSGFPYGCTMPPVSDPENWNWTSWEFAPMIGFAMHNTSYRVTVQWRYGVYMKGPRGPFQTSITINVQNLVVTSGDVGKVLKWDPERPELCDTSFGYSIECAQRKQVQVKISIYSIEGVKVYELTEQKICPGSYSFTWDGTMNTGYGGGYPPEEGSNIAPAGLYTFDVEVMGPAYYYDADKVRSNELQIIHVFVEDQGVDEESMIEHFYSIRYTLKGERNAKNGRLLLYDPDLTLVQSWNIASLGCLSHNNSTDGLVANYAGIEHEVWVSIPISSMSKVGTYYFVLYFEDDFADQRKNHQIKFTLAKGQGVEHTFCTVTFDDIAYSLAPSQTDIVFIPNSSCPPGNPPAPVPRPADIDGDGIKDWDYEGDTQVPIPGRSYTVGIFGILRGEFRGFLWRRNFINRGSFYLVAIGFDSNNNGRLDHSEILKFIGKCPWPHGINCGRIKLESDGRWYVYWSSTNDSNGNKVVDVGEPHIYFKYDVQMNLLKVVRGLYGILSTYQVVYSGPPNGYAWW